MIGGEGIFDASFVQASVEGIDAPNKRVILSNSRDGNIESFGFDGWC